MEKNNIFSKNFENPQDTTLSPEQLLSNIKDQETIVAELLKLACDTSSLDGKDLAAKIDKILEVRVKNELMINQLLNVGTINDKLSVQEAAQINNRSKDSLSDLIKIKQLLAGEATERISVEDESNQFRMSRITDMRGGHAVESSGEESGTE